MEVGGKVVGGLTLALGLLSFDSFPTFRFRFLYFSFRYRKKKREKREVGRDIAGPGYLPFEKARKFKTKSEKCLKITDQPWADVNVAINIFSQFCDSTSSQFGENFGVGR